MPVFDVFDMKTLATLNTTLIGNDICRPISELTVPPWELAIKRALGKLTMPDGLVAALRAGGFVPLAISADHAEHAPALPAHHRDPFDRMLIAQAQLEALALVTADEAVGAYDIELVDARR